MKGSFLQYVGVNLVFDLFAALECGSNRCCVYLCVFNFASFSNKMDPWCWVVFLK